MIAGINALVDLQQAIVQQVDLPLPAAKKIAASVLRLDKIHATVSGNKWFKLKYFLLDAIKQQKKTIVTFGGAYSNHLVATAYACARLGMQAVGVIRGARTETLSPALIECGKLGMQFHFMPRDMYAQKQYAYSEIRKQYADAYLIEEGGSNMLGAKGAAEILALVGQNEFSHICCAIGTGTTMAGLINSSTANQQVIGVCALKISIPENELEESIKHLTGNKKNYCIHYNYHFGGYAKKTPQLLEFMNEFYLQTGIPLDFVYTAKLLYGITDLGRKEYFPPDSRLLIIHTGGLQGNRSLPKNTLMY